MPKAVEIHALEGKIRILAEAAFEAGLIGDGHRKTYALKASINYDTLKSSWQNGRITPGNVQKLASVVPFDPTDPRWFDSSVTPERRSDTPSKYPGRDTVEAFRPWVRGLLGLPTGTTRIKSSELQLANQNMARFQVGDAGQAASLGQPSQLFLSITLETSVVENVRYGFRRVRLQINFSNPGQVTLGKRLGADCTVELAGAILEVRGGDLTTEWRLSVAEGLLDNEYATKEAPLCELMGIEVGQTFSAVLSVKPMDGEIVFIGDHDDMDGLQTRILSTMFANEMLGRNDSHGWRSLGTQQLRVVRGDQA